jgi:hypothetical protein
MRSLTFSPILQALPFRVVLRRRNLEREVIDRGQADFERHFAVEQHQELRVTVPAQRRVEFAGLHEDVLWKGAHDPGDPYLV